MTHPGTRIASLASFASVGASNTGLHRTAGTAGAQWKSETPQHVSQQTSFKHMCHSMQSRGEQQTKQNLQLKLTWHKINNNNNVVTVQAAHIAMHHSIKAKKLVITSQKRTNRQQAQLASTSALLQTVLFYQ
jgi:hypothetical protein